ncbi:MAG: hypothetical protein J7K53_00275 [Bacteroidales bacterium]|nr:hypothetical protein [Bacteroidales bacterium]
MRKVLFTLALSFILFSCGNNSQKTDTPVVTEKEAVKLTVSELLGNPDKYVDQKIIVNGIVDHVCKNGGKKMFILGVNPENRVKITTGENISVFDVELEGSDVTVEGIFTELRIDEEYLAKWEDELSQEKEEHGEHNESGKEHAEGLDQITALRNQIKESGEDHISQYFVECISYAEKTE